MKKILISVTAVILTLLGAYFAYTYYNGPKIIDGLVSEDMDDKGRPVGISTEFSTEDNIYFTAKANRFWIKKAQVVWYIGKVASANRLYVEENIRINNGGYFSTKLSIPKGLEEGHYSVAIYVDGNDIIETSTEFYVHQ